MTDDLTVFLAAFCGAVVAHGAEAAARYAYRRSRRRSMYRQWRAGAERMQREHPLVPEQTLVPQQPRRLRALDLDDPVQRLAFEDAWRADRTSMV